MVLVHVLDRYNLNSALVALGAVDGQVIGTETILLPIAQRKQSRVIAMTVYGHGELTQRALALDYALSLPDVNLAMLEMEQNADSPGRAGVTPR